MFVLGLEKGVITINSSMLLLIFRFFHQLLLQRTVNLRQKKAQITAFIIIGLLLLITVAAVYYILFWQQEKLPKTEFEFSQEPVTAYLQACLKDATEDGLELLGLQGGYIMVNADAEFAALDPFNSDVLSMNNGKLLLPYWYYQKRDGIDKLRIPKLYKAYVGDQSIQDQLEQYTLEKIKPCITNFQGFAEQNIIITQQGQPTISVDFLDESTEIKLVMPLELKKLDATESIDEISIKLSVALKKMYQLAAEITQHELNTLFLERTTLNLITAYSGVDDALLPPITGGLTFESCANRVFWFSHTVERDVKEMLTANTPFIKIANTDYDEIFIKDRFIATKEQQVRQGVYDGMIATVSNNKYPSVTSTISYDASLPISVTFGGKNQGLLQPQAMEINFIIAQLCMFDYSYLYNVQYPLLVSLSDSNSWLNNQPYRFQFPVQVVVKNNYPRIKLNDVLKDEIPSLFKQESHQCSPQQMISKESVVTIKDTAGKPVNDALVYFQCGPSYVTNSLLENTGLPTTTTDSFGETCFIGKTINGESSEKYPPCRGESTLTVKQANHVEKTIHMTNTISKQSGFNKEIVLDKVYERKLKLRKYFVKPPAAPGTNISIENPGIVLGNDEVVSCNIQMEQKPLQQYETALVTLTKLDTENGILPALPVALYEEPPTDTQGNVPASYQEPTIKISPGRYKVDITLLRKERYPGELTIKKESQSLVVPQGVLGAEKTIKYPDKDILIEQIFTGGADLIWEVTDAELRNKEALLFYVIDEGEPTRIEEIGTALQHRAGCGQLNYNTLKPRAV